MLFVVILVGVECIFTDQSSNTSEVVDPNNCTMYYICTRDLQVSLSVFCFVINTHK